MDADGRADAGETAFMFAAEKGLLNVVEYLVEDLDTDVNGTSDFLFTAIELAERHGHKNVVQYLLQHDAHPSKRNILVSEALREDSNCHSKSCSRWKGAREWHQVLVAAGDLR